MKSVQQFVRKLMEAVWIVLPFFMIVTFFAGYFRITARAKGEAVSGISFAPDEKAFTTDAGEIGYTFYAKGTKILTGVSGNLRELKQGEHYYLAEKTGAIPIASWEVHYAPGQCIHNNYGVDPNWHGLTYRKQNCHQFYKCGWIGTCADCNEDIALLFYMDRETAAEIKELTCGMDYYYLCPHCNNLEQGSGIRHRCKKISANRYCVQYSRNSRTATGEMEDSYFYYDNAKTYEGKEVAQNTRLRKNGFANAGFCFAGWNTERDGSGISFSDGQEVKNLSAVDKDTIILYAQWKKNSATLMIDPGEGTYNGKKEKTMITQEIGSVYTLLNRKTESESIFEVVFEAFGGSSVRPVFSKALFWKWIPVTALKGELTDNQYTFKGPSGNVDEIKAAFLADKILLPETKREGYSFGGWYSDRECTELVGRRGEWYAPKKALTTLYAKWVPLTLKSQVNTVGNEGKGAVDLQLFQEDRLDKQIEILQSKDGHHFVKVFQGNYDAFCFEPKRRVEIEDIPTPDLAAPMAVSKPGIRVEGTGEQARILWEAVFDRGTTYYHKAKSYGIKTKDCIGDSNIVQNEILTGIRGYYYAVDGNPETRMDSDNGYFTEKPMVTVRFLRDEKKFFHVASVDRAGNVSVTTHLLLEEGMNLPDIRTTPIQVSKEWDTNDYGSVCKTSEDTYYVRADGVTPFFLTMGGFLAGRKDLRLQIESLTCVADGNETEEISKLWIPKVTGEGEINPGDVQILGKGNEKLRGRQPVEITLMTEQAALSVRQMYIADRKLHNQKVFVYPRAEMGYRGETIASEEEENRVCGVWLCGDGEGPALVGISDLETTDFTENEEDILLQAVDELSGVAFFRILVEQEEEVVAVFEGDENNRISLSWEALQGFCEEGYSIRIEAGDRVGNETVYVRDLRTYGIRATLSRILSPHEPVFRGGESGILRVEAFGYVDRVEVRFPEEMIAINPELNKEYWYENPTDLKVEEITFMVPLYTPVCEDYVIEVRGYKNGTNLSQKPVLCKLSVTGDVLWEWRTRLR